MNHVNRCLRALGACATLLFAAQESLAQDFAQNEDVTDVATIYEEFSTNNGGGRISMCVGNYSTAQTTRRGLVRWQLAGIPAGARITRVIMHLTQELGSPKGATLLVHRVTTSWERGAGNGGFDACESGSDVPGVDWASQPVVMASESASVELPTTDETPLLIDTDVGDENDGLIADVQAWINGAPNQGWRFSLVQEGQQENSRVIIPDAITVHFTQDPQDFNVNEGVNDAWVNPATLGQGFFFVVFPDTAGGLFFMSWFTFDVQRPDASIQAILGEAAHRWVTALGAWTGNVVVLNVELTTGGIFDSAEPKAQQTSGYGTIIIEFHDCDHATLTYEIPSLGLRGTIDVTRVVKDNVLICEALQGG